MSEMLVETMLERKLETYGNEPSGNTDSDVTCFATMSANAGRSAVTGLCNRRLVGSTR